MFATDAQIAQLTAAASAHGLTARQVAVEYTGDPAISLARIPANIIGDMIARAGETVDTGFDWAAHAAAGEAQAAAAAIAAEQRAVEIAQEQAAKAAAEEEAARLDAILAERGQVFANGKEKREARRLLRRELEAA